MFVFPIGPDTTCHVSFQGGDGNAKMPAEIAHQFDMMRKALNLAEEAMRYHPKQSPGSFSRDGLGEWREVPASFAWAMQKIFEERQRQDVEWGGPAHDDSHEWFEWFGFIEKQCALARKNGGHVERLVKIAALAVAAMQSCERLKS